MYQQLRLQEFLEAVSRLVRESRSGVVFLVAKNGGWGKLEVKSGEITSLTFKSRKGSESLPILQQLEEVQFLFQEQKGTASHGADGDAAITTEEFFGFFGVRSPVPGARNQRSYRRASVKLEASRRNTKSQVAEGVTILVVDDSAIARKAARIPLETEGYRVVEAVDGFEALGQLQNEKPDLVLLDLVMPGIDGYRVLDLIRGNPNYAGLPVIMLTARDGLIDKLKGRISDLDAYLTKPFEPFDLIREVAKQLQK